MGELEFRFLIATETKHMVVLKKRTVAGQKDSQTDRQ